MKSLSRLVKLIKTLKSKDINIIKNISILVIILLTFSIPVRAQNKTEKIDEFMTYCYKNGLFNGTILIAKNGNVIYKQPFGFLRINSNENIKKTSPFYLASISKQFTSMAIMMLKERNKLKYEDKLIKYLPEMQGYSNEVTIRHLLTHTSGMPGYPVSPRITNRDVLNFLIKQDSLQFKPGDQYSYSNSGFILLALIVEKVTGQRFYKFMEENIFKPLKMNESLVFNEDTGSIPGKAFGFNKYEEMDDYNLFTAGAGGIYSTVEDLYKWDQALYTEKLVKASTLNEAFSYISLNDGTISNDIFGWEIHENKDGKIVEYSGGWRGFSTYIGRNLNKRSTVILLTNSGIQGKILDLKNILWKILENKPFNLPKISIAKKLFEELKINNISSVVEIYYKLKHNNPDQYDFEEFQLNDLGYFLMSKNQIKEAIEIFKLNIESFPSSANAYDSLGEAYMVNGNKENAIKNYEKSLELNPNNVNAKEMLKKLKK